MNVSRAGYDPYNCTNRIIQVSVDPDQNTAPVEVLPGAFLSLEPGYHTFSIPVTNCTVQIRVNSGLFIRVIIIADEYVVRL